MKVKNLFFILAWLSIFFISTLLISDEKAGGINNDKDKLKIGLIALIKIVRNAMELAM